MFDAQQQFDRQRADRLIGLVQGAYYGRLDETCLLHRWQALANLRDTDPRHVEGILPGLLGQLIDDTRFDGRPITASTLRNLGFEGKIIHAAVPPATTSTMPRRMDGDGSAFHADGAPPTKRPSLQQTVGFAQGIYRDKLDKSNRLWWHHPVWVRMRASARASEWFLNGLVLHDIIEDTKPGPKADPHLCRHPVTPYDLAAMDYDPRTIWMVFGMSHLDKNLSYPDYIHQLVNGDFGEMNGQKIPEDIRTEVAHAVIVGKTLDNRENRSAFRLEKLAPEEAQAKERKWLNPSLLLEERVKRFPLKTRQMMMGVVQSGPFFDGEKPAVDPQALPELTRHWTAARADIQTAPRSLSPERFRRRIPGDDDGLQLGCDPEPSQRR